MRNDAVLAHVAHSRTVTPPVDPAGMRRNPWPPSRGIDGRHRRNTQRRTELSVFLADPKVPIDTNHLERALRPIPMGRRNWLFCWTEIGAKYAGIVQSLIATCRLHGVQPYDYLVDVLQRIDSHPAADVQRLTPRLWKEHFAANPLRSDLDRPRYHASG